MKTKEFITELAYPGNIGIMELAKFFEIATTEQKIQFKRLRKLDDNDKSAWEYMQTVLGVKLHD